MVAGCCNYHTGGKDRNIWLLHPHCHQAGTDGDLGRPSKQPMAARQRGPNIPEPYGVAASPQGSASPCLR